MERIFGDQSFQSLLLYLDDIIIFSSSFEEHLKRLELVLTRVQNNHLKLKLVECWCILVSLSSFTFLV